MGYWTTWSFVAIGKVEGARKVGNRNHLELDSRHRSDLTSKLFCQCLTGELVSGDPFYVLSPEVKVLQSVGQLKT